MNKYINWLTEDGKNFQGTKATLVAKIVPGYYELTHDSWDNPKLIDVQLKQDGFCNFVNGPMSAIKEEVSTFWKKDFAYKELNICHKRSILLYGPPGCGKSAILNGIILDVIQKDGIAFKVESIEYLIDNFRNFREIEPDKSVCFIIEDIETFCDNSFQEDNLLEILDGTTFLGSNILFISTTNKLDKIPARVKYRPSRVDTLIEVTYPDVNQKLEYAKFIYPNISDSLIELIKNKTAYFSLADIKEIIISVFVYGKSGDQAVQIIEKLKKEGE